MVYIGQLLSLCSRPLCAVVAIPFFLAIPVPRIVEIHCVQTDGGGGNMIQCGDGGNMIQCDACNQWFHDVCKKYTCMGKFRFCMAFHYLFMNLNSIVCSINSFITSYYISCRTCFPNLTIYSYIYIYTSVKTFH